MVELLTETSSSPNPSESPQSENQEQSSTFSEFDLGAEPGAIDPEIEDGGTEGGPGADGRLYVGRDEFFVMFRSLFEAPNVYFSLKGDQPLESLKIDPADPSAREASDALYEIIWDIPALRWILEPESEWMQRLFAIGLFLGGRALMVRAEISARRADRRAAADAKKPDPEPDLSKPATPPDEGPGVDQGEDITLEVANDG